jgi:hypothetical protein
MPPILNTGPTEVQSMPAMEGGTSDRPVDASLREVLDLGSHDLGIGIDDCDTAVRRVAAQKNPVDPDGQHGALLCVDRKAGGSEHVPVVIEEGSRGANCVVLDPIGLGGKGKLPSPHSSGDGALLFVDLDAGSRKDTAVVRAAGSRPMLVDRALVVDQHRAATVFVIAEHDMAGG